MNEDFTLRDGVTLASVGLLLLVGGFIVTTPRADSECNYPKPLFVAPGERSPGVLGYCLYEQPLALRFQPPARQTDICANTRREAEALLQPTVAARSQAFQRCVRDVSPIRATWNHAISVFRRVTEFYAGRQV